MEFREKKKNYYAFELKPQYRHNETDENIHKLFEKIKEQLLDKKRYYGYRWDEDTYHILNIENMDLFQLSEEERNLVLYPFDRCSEKTIIDLFKEINDGVREDLKITKYCSEPV